MLRSAILTFKRITSLAMMLKWLGKYMPKSEIEALNSPISRKSDARDASLEPENWFL